MRKVIFSISIGFILYVAGYLTGIISHVGDPVVYLEIINNAHSDIANFTVEHEHGTAIARSLKPGARELLKFYSPAETSFHVVAELSQNRTVKGTDAYAEAGYYITVQVTDDSIKMNIALSGPTLLWRIFRPWAA